MRNFTDVLGDLQAGTVFHELNEKLGEVVQAVKEHGKPGELVFKMKIKPISPLAVEVSDEVVSKVPQPARLKTTLFYDDDGALRREDPRQQKMDLREVASNDADIQPVKVVDQPSEVMELRQVAAE